ncbi:MAG: hypothetical protein Q8P22_08995 [Chloroflexota bacterium]|nr:hypothetical protein [Chloroflexota bacterium]
MTTESTSERFFNALTETYTAMLDAIKTGNERGYRVSSTLIEEARKGQQEAIELGKKWAQAPTDVPALYGAVIELVTKAQSRALELAREWVDDLAESRQDAREVIQRVVNANRGAAEAAVEVARGAFGTASAGVRQATGRVSPKGPADIQPPEQPSEDVSA